MSMNFLLGVPGKLKTLLDRWSSIKAGYLDTNITSRASSTQATDIQGSGFASGTDSLKVLSDNIDLIKGTSFVTGTDSLKILSDKIDVIDSNVDSINTDVDTTISSRATATALQTVDNNVDTILSRVTATVATSSALATVDTNVDTIKTAMGAQAVRYASGSLSSGSSGFVQVLSVSSSGYFTYFNTDDTSSFPKAQIIIDGETPVDLSFRDGDNIAAIVMGPARFNTSLVVKIYETTSNINYHIGYSLDQ